MSASRARFASIQLLNCNGGTGTTVSALAKFASDPSCMVLVLQEPSIENRLLPPTHPSFHMHTPTPIKPRCVTYTRANVGMSAHSHFQHGNSFLGTRITLQKMPTQNAPDTNTQSNDPTETPETPNQRQNPTPPEDPFSFTLYNFYSPGRAKAAADLFDAGFSPDQDAVIVGDLNAHHPWWYGDQSESTSQSSRPSPASEKIAQWLQDHHFTLHNVPGIHTHFPRDPTKNPTIIDLCLSRGSISNFVHAWTTDPDNTSDHANCGLLLSLDAPVSIAKQTKTRNWKKTDWDTFRKTVQAGTSQAPTPISNANDALDAVKEITQVINEAVEAAVPLTYSRRGKQALWWNPELTQAHTKLVRCERRFRKSRDIEEGERCRRLRSKWTSDIKKAKAKYWEKALKDVSRTSVWGTIRRHHTHQKPIPPINGRSDFAGKAQECRNAFFPDVNSTTPPPLPETANIPSSQDLSSEYHPVTAGEFERVLQNVRYGSAVGSDRLSYTTIREVHLASPKTLPSIFSGLLRHGVHPTQWKDAICLVIPKQGKKEYSSPKSYRPISLQSCFGKLLEILVAKRLSVAAFKCGAMLPSQMGGRSGNSAIDALIRTLDHGAEALETPIQNRKQTPRPYLLTHDIEGAFNNVRPETLVEIMRRRKMPTYLTEWTRSFCTNRTLAFSFDGQIETPQPFRCGLPQGSPVSPALFLIYCAVVIEPPKDQIEETQDTSYIDDVNTVQISRTPLVATQALQRRTDQQSRIAAYLQLNFAKGKSDLLHIIPHNSSKKTGPTHANEEFRILLRTPHSEPTPIMPSPRITYLGIVIDERLSFKAHATQAAAKGLESLMSLIHLRSGQYNGSVNYGICHYLTYSMILPKMLWASPVWWTGTDTICDPLKVVYHKVARWITGIRNPTAPVSKLLAAAQLPPMNLYLDYMSARYAVRLHFLEEGHELDKLVTPPPPAGTPRPHINLPSINRLLSFTDPMIDGPLEDRKTTASAQPGIQTASPVHKEKGKKARETHRKWVATLPEGTIVMYTDGSKMDDGSTGCGWAVYRTAGGQERLVLSGCCYLGKKAEVIDAELHAVHEGLLAVKNIEVPKSKSYVCIDNTSAIVNLSENHQNAQYARQSLSTAKELTEMGWEILTLWNPSHCDIAGNEKADEMAKKGAAGEEEMGECFYACITKNWLLAEAKRTLYRKWKLEIPQATCSLSAPTHYDNLTYRQTAAVLRIYAGRTEADGLRNDTPTPCKCGMANLSSAHILTECRLMDQARAPLTKKFPEGEIMTTEIAIRPKYVQLVSEFARKTGLGYTNELRYDPPLANQQQYEPSDTESEWDSEFGSQFGAFE